MGRNRTQTSSSNSKYCFRSAKQAAPALGLVQSLWALDERELPIDRSLEIACSEGSEYLEIGLREERLAESKALLNRFPLKLIAQGWATSADDSIVFFQRAVELNGIALNLHLGHAYLSLNEAIDLVGAVQRQSEVFGIPVFLETHRGRLTQDLFRTTELLVHFPDIVVTLDLSHYVVAGETLGGSEELFCAHVMPLLSRTALIHGRISDGQAIQVPADGRLAFTPLIQSLWRQAMRLWLIDAPDDAVFLFEPELGPPPYACLHNGVETFSRTAESRVLTRLAHQAWAEAQADAFSNATLSETLPVTEFQPLCAGTNTPVSVIPKRT